MDTFKRLITVLLLLVVLEATAQDIKVGQPCPDISMEKIVNFKKSNAKISDFKGQLLILDFWATWCQPCIAMFSKTDSLQKQFGNAIQFLPVSDENENTVAPFLSKIQEVRHLLLPSVVSDRALNSHFVHNGIPHYVWIDSKGMVAGITGSDEITESNIREALAGHEIKAVAEDAAIEGFSPEKPFFLVSNVSSDEQGATHITNLEQGDVLLHSVLTKSKLGRTATFYSDSSRITCLESSVGSLYRMSAGHWQPRFWTTNRTIWQVSNPALAVFTDSAASRPKTQAEIDNYEKNYCFCYEFLAPGNLTFPQRCDYMVSDLNRYFGILYGIQGRMETRTVNCLKLVRTTSEDKMATKGESQPGKSNAFTYRIYNKPLYNLWFDLRGYLQAMPPLIDATEYTGNVDLELTCDFRDVNSINQALEKYGLRIIEAREAIPMIVITDKK